VRGGPVALHLQLLSGFRVLLSEFRVAAAGQQRILGRPVTRPGRSGRGCELVRSSRQGSIHYSSTVRQGFSPWLWPLGYGVIGSTTDSGSVSLGSSPGTPAKLRRSVCSETAPGRFAFAPGGRPPGPPGVRRCAPHGCPGGPCAVGLRRVALRLPRGRPLSAIGAVGRCAHLAMALWLTVTIGSVRWATVPQLVERWGPHRHGAGRVLRRRGGYLVACGSCVDSGRA
jgi:hypothetical protein